MARKFINMYMDNTDMRGYWIVEYLDENGVEKKINSIMISTLQIFTMK